MERKVLLVGGAGYIGSELTGYFLGLGYKVRSLDLLLFDNQTCVYPFLLNKNYEFIYGDFCDEKVMSDALSSGVTDVVILAGLVGDPITKKYPEASQKINNDGILNLIRLVNGRGIKRLVFLSTCSNYGLITGDTLADEAFELKPLSLYAKSKVLIEKELLSLKGKVDYIPVILRFATAFGLSSRMRFDLTVSEFTRAMYLKKDLLVYDADTWRPYCHVRDFSRAINMVMLAPAEKVAFEVFNVGGDVNNYTKQMIIDEIKSFIPDAPVRYQEKGPDPRNYRVSFAKIKDRIGFTPEYTVRDGVSELLAGLSKHLFDNVDERRNFYGNYEIDYK
jgi:nucleoside-diphosphate-sugar epimerase